MLIMVKKKPQKQDDVQSILSKIQDLRQKKAWKITFTPDKERVEEDTVFAGTYEMAYVEFSISHGKNCDIIEIKEIKEV